MDHSGGNGNGTGTGTGTTLRRSSRIENARNAAQQAQNSGLAGIAEDLLVRQGVQRRLVGACVYHTTRMATILGAHFAHSAAGLLIDLGLIAALAAASLLVLGIHGVFQAVAYVVLAPWMTILRVLGAIKLSCVVVGRILRICGRLLVILLRWATTYQGHRLFFLDPLTMEAILPSSPVPHVEGEVESDEGEDMFVDRADVAAQEDDFAEEAPMPIFC